MSFDAQYLDAPALFGVEPESLLVRYAHLIPPGWPVVDVGAGQGRHALYLARQGWTVDALEPSEVGATEVEARAAAERLPIRVHRATAAEAHLPVSAYGGVMLFGLLPLLCWSEIDELSRWVDGVTAPSGVVFLTAFTTDDPAYPQVAATSEARGPHSWRRPDGSVRTYLVPGAPLPLGQGYSCVHRWEGQGPLHLHGDGEPERHGMVEAVLVRS